MAAYLDLHAHFLPALDDGARDLAMGMEMVQALAGLGFTELNATPHQRMGMFLPERSAIDAAFAQVVVAAGTAHPALRIGVAAENFWDEVLHGRTRGSGLPTYTGDRAFLFEVHPQFMPPNIENELFQIRVRGKLPVMAHPERYVDLQRNLDRAEALGRTAALVVDLGALDGAHGRPQMKTARELVKRGLAHAAASDIHTPEDQRSIAAGMAWIRKEMGAAGLDRLLSENPRRILTGEIPT